MNTLFHGSANHVVRTPATSATPSTRKATPLASSTARDATTSSHSRPTWVKPSRVTSGGGGDPVVTDGYSITSITPSVPSSTPTIAAFTTTGFGRKSPMSRDMDSPSIRYGGDNTTKPNTSRYHVTAASTSATCSAVC